MLRCYGSDCPLTMSILGSDFLRQKHNHSITLPLQRYQIRAHYQGFASPISVVEFGSVFHTPTCHVSVDSSTNAHNQTILDVAVPVSQIGIDARMVLVSNLRQLFVETRIN